MSASGLKVVTFGEIMMRLSPPDRRRFDQTETFDLHYGGAEANVAAALALWGVHSVFVTRLPDNDLGRAAYMYLRKHGIDTSLIILGGSRLGIYFLEHGASQRPSKVVYDRKGSAFAELGAGNVNWADAWAGASWFHFTGITPALSPIIAADLQAAIANAKSMGIRISCDVNYRKQLWHHSEAERVLSGLLNYCDMVIMNEEDASTVFGIARAQFDHATGRLRKDAYEQVAKELSQRFPSLSTIAFSLRESVSASVNNWSGALWTRSGYCTSVEYNIHPVDRVGAGDAFAAGLIFATLTNQEPQEMIDFAVAASCLKHTVPGDFSHASFAEVEALRLGAVSGRIQR